MNASRDPIVGELWWLWVWLPTGECERLPTPLAAALPDVLGRLAPERTCDLPEPTVEPNACERDRPSLPLKDADETMGAADARRRVRSVRGDSAWGGPGGAIALGGWEAGGGVDGRGVLDMTRRGVSAGTSSTGCRRLLPLLSRLATGSWFGS